MRVKVDENLPIETAELLRGNGHDAMTIFDQQMVGEPDPKVASLQSRRTSNNYIGSRLFRYPNLPPGTAPPANLMEFYFPFLLLGPDHRLPSGGTFLTALKGPVMVSARTRIACAPSPPA